MVKPRTKYNAPLTGLFRRRSALGEAAAEGTGEAPVVSVLPFRITGATLPCGSEGSPGPGSASG